MIDHSSVVYAKNDIELSWSIKFCANYDEIRQDNDVTDHLRMVYTRTEIELSGLIWLSVVYEEN